MKYLFVDDLRMPGDVTWVKLPFAEWCVVRSFDQAVSWVKKHGFPDVVSFDHDLGHEVFDTTPSGLVLAVENSNERSGYDFAKWLIEHDLDTDTMPGHFAFYVHSMNPVGADNIRNILSNYMSLKHRKCR